MFVPFVRVSYFEEVIVMNHICFFIRRRCFTGVFILFLVLTACAIFFCAKIHAEGKNERVDEVVSYQSVLVCRGNSLWSIAKEHLDEPTNAEIQAYVEEIISLNNLSSGHIHTGNYILIPTYTSASNM